MSRVTLRRAVNTTALILVVLGAALFAQQPENPVSSARPTVSIWDGVYAENQAERGLASYQRSCAKCHRLADGTAPSQFTGNAFWTAWGEDSLDRLYLSVRKNMPADSPGSLSDTTYVDIIAFLLHANAIPAGKDELTPDKVSSVRVARRDSDGTLPAGAFVAVSGCLAKAGNGWKLTHATAPERYNGDDASIDAPRIAARTAGSATFDLLFVVSSLDKMAGHTVLVRGLLVRGPSDGINVTSVDSVASQCTP